MKTGKGMGEEPTISIIRHYELVYLHTVKTLEVFSIDNSGRHNNCLCEKGVVSNRAQGG